MRQRPSLSVAEGDGPGPRGGTVRPAVSFRGGGVSVPTGHTGPAPVPVRGSTQGTRAPPTRFQPIGRRLEIRPASLLHLALIASFEKS